MGEIIIGMKQKACKKASYAISKMKMQCDMNLLWVTCVAYNLVKLALASGLTKISDK